MRHEWDMNFATSGEEALAVMGQEPVDVVVADMRMPGMNGAALLNEVIKRHPQTVRFILSGHADKDLIMKCVGSTHQYLSKPCESEALKAAVQRASAVSASMQNKRLKRLVGMMDRLPSPPSLHSETIEKLKDPETMVEDVAKTIARDIGMTAKVLKLVNSAFYGLRSGWPALAVQRARAQDDCEDRRGRLSPSVDGRPGWGSGPADHRAAGHPY